MTRKLLETLAKKFANDRFDAKNKEKLESFYYDQVNQLKTIIGEMSGDLLLIKEKGLPIDIRHLFGKIYQQIIALYKEIDPENPYAGTLNLIKWIETKHNKDLLDNLDYLIKKYLNKNELNFHSKEILRQPTTTSINKFMQITKQLKKFIISNPVIDIQQQLSTINQNIPINYSNSEDFTKIY